MCWWTSRHPDHTSYRNRASLLPRLHLVANLMMQMSVCCRCSGGVREQQGALGFGHRCNQVKDVSCADFDILLSKHIRLRPMRRLGFCGGSPMERRKAVSYWPTARQAPKRRVKMRSIHLQRILRCSTVIFFHLSTDLLGHSWLSSCRMPTSEFVRWLEVGRIIRWNSTG